MPISIVGMHRSGTSAITRILRAAGLYLGPDADLMPSKPENPEGYWENARFVAINDRLLEALGGAWDLPPEFPPGWTDLESLREVVNEARALIAEFDGHEPWGWKDPRNSLTLPFWTHLIPDLRVVVCLRHPGDVARSLVARNPSGTERFGFALWRTYNERILSSAEARRRLITRYESYFKEFDSELHRLLSFAGIKMLPETVAACRTVFVQRLRHHASESQPGSLPHSVSELYERLLAESEGNRITEPEPQAAGHAVDASAFDAAMHEISVLRNRLERRDAAVNEQISVHAGLSSDLTAARARLAAAEKLNSELTRARARDSLRLVKDVQKLTARTESMEAEIRRTAEVNLAELHAVAEQIRALEVARRPSVVRRAASAMRDVPAWTAQWFDVVTQRVYAPRIKPLFDLRVSARPDYTMESVGDDPQLAVEGPFPWGWTELRLRGRADPPALVKLYFDHGTGMSEASVYSLGVLRPATTELVSLINLKRCKGLRLDPSIAPGHISIDSFTLKRVGAVRVIGRALSAYRAKASARDASWSTIARKALSRLVREGFGGLRGAVARQISVPIEIGTVVASSEYELERQVRSVLGSTFLMREIGSEPISLRAVASAEVSVIIPVWNRAELTYRCLQSLRATFDELPCELIVVDNGSTDRTTAILAGIENIRVIRNETNLGFVQACNQAAAVARGEYLLFLNNDTHVPDGAVGRLVQTIRSNDRIGAVGGRLIDLTGRLQEAGSIVWSDGSCLGYGRGDAPFKPEYSFVRDVHYCSAALLLTQRSLFVELGGFDRRYEPAYYEDADFCMAVHAAGLRVVYQPLATLIHQEFGSSSGAASAIDLQRKNQRTFVTKWSGMLANFMPPDPARALHARVFPGGGRRILFVDDRIPDPALGSGYPRSHSLLTSLAGAGHQVTLFPLQFPEPMEPVRTNLQQGGVEVLHGSADRPLDLARHLEERGGYYDILFVSRPHNMRRVRTVLDRVGSRPKVIYDAEAIYAERDLARARLNGIAVDPVAARRMVAEEVDLAKGADCIVVVSDRDRRIFTDHGARNVHSIGFTVGEQEEPPGHEERRDLLFVGAILGSPSPNEDAVLHFLDDVFPRVLEDLDCSLNIVGTNESQAVRARASKRVVVTGRVQDVAPFYRKARVIVVPTRYAAGLPFKLYEAAAFGVPAVVTPLIAEQVGWREGEEFLVGHNEEDFASKVLALYRDGDLWDRISSGAKRAASRDCSSETFFANVMGALGTLDDRTAPVAPHLPSSVVRVGGAPLPEADSVPRRT